MKKIPAFLLSISISITITILYHYPLSLSTVYAESIDISPQAEYGDTINIQTGAASKEDLKGEIGPSRPNQLKFPDLSKEKGFYSREDGFFNALPQGTQRDLKFNDPSLQRIEAELKGKIAHPACGELIVTKSSYNPETGETNKEVEKDKQTPIKSDPVYFTPSQDFFQTLLRTRFWQSILVPNKGSNLDFAIAKPTEPAAAARLADCIADTSGKTSEIITVANDPPRPLGFLGGLFDGIINFFQQLLVGKSVTVEANLEQTKYLPGETVLADQMVGNEGFLNFFKPEGAQFTNQGDEEEQVRYKVLKQDKDIGVTYKGVSSLKSGTLDLVKSLYPEGMAPESLASLTPVSDNFPAGSSAGLTFAIPYRDSTTSIPVERKNQIIATARSSWPNSKIQELWDTVVARAVGAGINPAFALAIWIEESGASAVGQSAFGCFPSGDTSKTISFERSLECFVYFTQTEHPNDFTDWVHFFCGPQIVPICRDNPNFLKNFKDWYDRIVPPGTPGAATPIGTEF